MKAGQRCREGLALGRRTPPRAMSTRWRCRPADELAGASLPGAGEYDVRGTALHDHTVVHEHDLVSHIPREGELSWVTITMVQPSSASSLMTWSTSPTSSGSSAEVGLVEEQQLGSQGQGTNDADSLLLSAGELEGVAVALVGEAYAGEEPFCPQSPPPGCASAPGPGPR